VYDSQERKHKIIEYIIPIVWFNPFKAKGSKVGKQEMTSLVPVNEEEDYRESVGSENS